MAMQENHSSCGYPQKTPKLGSPVSKSMLSHGVQLAGRQLSRWRVYYASAQVSWCLNKTLYVTISNRQLSVKTTYKDVKCCARSQGFQHFPTSRAGLDILFRKDNLSVQWTKNFWNTKIPGLLAARGSQAGLIHGMCFDFHILGQIFKWNIAVFCVICIWLSNVVATGHMAI